MEQQTKKQSKPRMGAAVATGLLLFAALLSCRSPRPREELTAVVNAPAATRLEDGARPEPVSLEFSGSAARLEEIGKPSAAGVMLEPKTRGVWTWESDRRLTFVPTEDWTVGREYRVRLDPSALAPKAKLASRELRFSAPGFSGSFATAEFYVDPQDPSIKRVIATLRFSHPVDADDLERRLSLTVESKRRGLFAGPVRHGLEVSYDKFRGQAFVRSQPVAIPAEDAVMRLRVAPGLRASRGGLPSREGLEIAVRVPGLHTMFRLEQARLEIIRDERQEPEQALIVEATSGVDPRKLAAGLSVYVLPIDIPSIQGRAAQRNVSGWDPATIGPEVLALSSAATLSPIPAEHAHAAVQAFKLRVPPGRFVLVRAAKGIEGYGGYVLGRDFRQVLQVPDYPMQIRILHEGAVLGLRGQRKLSLASEGAAHVRFEIGRVLPGRINHLASQSEGRFSHPMFTAYRFGQDDVTERFTEIRSLPGSQPGRVSYLAFDFTPYLASRQGLFFLKAEHWDPVHKRALPSSDHRLILVTDLGLLVKDNADGSHDVFVQSLSNGRPVAGARVEVIGRNGVPTVAALTGVSGRAHFPRLADFKREKEPVAYVVRFGEDLSFLPYSRKDRKLDFSRFDVGGVFTHGRPDRLEAFLFSDRGLYRPGETIHAGLLVRSLDWAQPAGLPLEAVVMDPRGLEVQRVKISLSTSAFEEVSYRTEENCPTGFYRVDLYTIKDGRRGSLLGSVSARVEDFLPDRLRIATRLSPERPQGWVSPDALKAFVNLKTLYGIDAEGRRVSAKIALVPAAPAFKSFAGYRFFDPSLAKKSFTETLADGVTDARGDAVFELDLSRFAAATYRLTFSAEGFEAAGGRGVSSESSALVSPRTFLIGFKADGALDFLRRASTRSVEVAAVGPDGLGVAVPGLKLELIEERHVSALVKQEDGTFRYQSVPKQTTLERRDLSLPKAGDRLALPTIRPGDFALVIRDHAGLELNRLPFSVTGSADLSRSLDKNAELQIGLDRADYAPGQEVSVQIRAPYTGAGLMTIERDRVYAHRWFKSETSASLQTIRVPESLEGNAYVNVQFLRAPDSPEVFMSPLSYGVAPFTVSRSRRSLPVTLEAPADLKPGQTLTLTVRAPRPARVAVFAADEGILQAADYQTPDPLSFFFKKRALEVGTFQILDLLLPEYALARAALAPGGDKGAEALGRNLNPFKRKLDEPAVFWSGIVSVGPEGRQISWRVPESFQGTLRVMAVAADPSSVGAAEARTLVRGPLIVTPSAPVFAAPGDEFELSVAVANGIAGSGAEAELELSIEPSGHLEAVAGKEARLKVPEGRERSATFRLRARPSLGSASVRIVATRGQESAGRTVTLSVRPASPYESSLSGGYLRKGSAVAAVPRRLFPQHRKLEVVVSPLPLALSRGLLAYLDRYPHPCTEQLVSQAFAALALRKRPELGHAPDKVGALMARTLHLLRARQNAEGAFGYWAANSDHDPFQTVYALHFLTEAREGGVDVPAELFNRARAFVEALAAGSQAAPAPPRLRAYALYVLTKNARVTTDALEALRRELSASADKAWRRDIGAAYMASSYKLLRLDAQAGSLIEGAAIGAVARQGRDYAAYYDGLSHDSQLLALLARHFPDRLRRLTQEDWAKVVDPILANRYNTLSSAYAILALDAAASALGEVSSSRASATEIGAGRRRPLPLSVGLFSRSSFSPEASSVEFANDGTVPLFYQAVQSGFDLAAPAAPLSAGLEIRRDFLNAAGQPVTSAELGEDVTVRLRLRALGDSVPHVAIVDLLPAGLEASRDRGERLAVSLAPDHVEMRDDRVVVYAAIGREAADFSYHARAVSRGRYSVPPAFAESMYDRSARARSTASFFEVR